MITKADIKLIRSLEHKKYRLQEGLFVAEGPKLIGDLRHRFELVRLWDDPEDVKKASLLQHPQGQLALFRLPEESLKFKVESLKKPYSLEFKVESLILALDGVQDPGNVGTILRTADWFGVREVYCSRDTADCYAPKVVQATMGSLARVRVHYVDLVEWLKTLSGSPLKGEKRVPIYGTLLDGENLYEKRLDPKGVLVMGNEGKGLSQEVRELVTERLLIPQGQLGGVASSEGPESLNVAVATAVVLAAFGKVV